VAYELTAAETEPKFPRQGRFMPDPKVRGASAVTGDYRKSGYDRGHMAPAADMRWDRRAMRESFYLSNVCPQNSNLNRGRWGDLEQDVRRWAKACGAVYVVCGPIVGRQPLCIGTDQVAVPDSFFKVLCRRVDSHYQAIGFIFPNQACHAPVASYALSVDSVEKRTSLDFFSQLPDSIENRIEAVCHPQDWLNYSTATLPK
jgi:endonuclease G